MSECLIYAQGGIGDDSFGASMALMLVALIASMAFSGRVPELTAADFDVSGAVSQSLAGGGGNAVHWLLLVHAPTCSLCNALRPVWRSVSDHVARAADVTDFFVGRVDGSAHPALSRRLGVRQDRFPSAVLIRLQPTLPPKGTVAEQEGAGEAAAAQRAADAKYVTWVYEGSRTVQDILAFAAVRSGVPVDGGLGLVRRRLMRLWRHAMDVAYTVLGRAMASASAELGAGVLAEEQEAVQMRDWRDLARGSETRWVLLKYLVLWSMALAFLLGALVVMVLSALSRVLLGQPGPKQHLEEPGFGPATLAGSAAAGNGSRKAKCKDE